MIGSENLKNGFYSDKFEVIENAVRSYADVKSGPKPENLEAIKQSAMSVISHMMVESGLRNDENAFISLDNEFFDEGGAFSETKLGEFQKLIVQYYALNDIKWTFAGTTSSLTKLSKNAIENEGLEYEEMLPVEIKRKHNQEEIRKITGITPAASKVYIYPDNSISTQYIPKKAKVKFNNLEDKNTKLWKTDYDPNLKINKKGWTAGFNSNNNWEYMSYESEKIKSNQAVSPISKFTDKENKNISLLHAPGHEEIIFMDPENLLMDGEEERFYSINGELYGSRNLDRESTIEEIKQTFKKTGIEKLTGVVIQDNDGSAGDYYKNNFKEFLDEKTRFYTPDEETLVEKVIEIKKYIKENDISSDLLENYFDLVKKGKSREEIYDNMMSGLIKGEVEENLDIFANSQDMETFISMPEINEDVELKDSILKMKVPQEQTVKVSNSIRNIVNNYDSLFKSTGLDRKELSESAYRLLAKNENPENLSKINILKEKKLGDLIAENGIRTDTTDIPSFKKAFKSEKDYFNLFDAAGRKKWNDKLVKEKIISEENVKLLNSSLDEMNIPAGKKDIFSNSLQDTFDEYITIRQNTGMKPEELADSVYNKIAGVEDPKLNKKIVFEKNIVELIKESSLDNPFKIVRVKEDIIYKSSTALENSNLNLIKNTDVDIFALQSLNDFEWDKDEEKNTTVQLLKNAKIPAGSGKYFTAGINEIMKKHKVKKNGAMLLNDLKLFTDAIHDDIKDLPSDIKRLSDNLKRNGLAFKNGVNLFDEKQSRKFLSENKDHIDSEKLDELLNQYEYKYEKFKPGYIEQMPLVYNSDFSGNIDDRKRETAKENEDPNTFMNLGWKIKLNKDKKTVIDFTGEKSNEEISSIFKNAGFASNDDSSEINEEGGHILLNMDSIVNEAAGDLSMPQYIYANPYAGIIKKRQQIMNKLNEKNPQTQKITNENFINETEEQRLIKINENYMKDKQALARTKSQTVENSPKKKNDESTQSDSKIIQSADEFIDEIKKEIDRSIF